MFHRIAVWRVFVTLDFSTFSTLRHPIVALRLDATGREQLNKMHASLDTADLFALRWPYQINEAVAVFEVRPKRC